MKARFYKIEQARAVCQEHRLNQLEIPRVVQFAVGGYTVLAEERIAFSESPGAIAQHYQEAGCHLTTAINQLASFICLTVFSDVDYRNIPVLGCDQIGLIDLEEMDGPEIGIYGTGGHLPRKGLINCVSQLHQPLVQQIADIYRVKAC
jgi:hypothetical protein